MPSLLPPDPRNLPDRAPGDDFDASPDFHTRLHRQAAAGLLVLGVCLGTGTCTLAADLAEYPLERLVFSTLGIELFLGFAALAGAAMTWEPIAIRLGLGRGGLPVSLVLLAALGTVGLSHAIDSAISIAGLRDESVLAELDAILYGASGRTLLLAIFGLGIAPGVCEELLCRGLLQRGLVRSYGAVAGIGISALVFGAIHLEWIQGTAATLLGLYLGVVAYRAKSIRPAIFCHCCNNLAALAIGVSGLGGDPSIASAAVGCAVATVAIATLFLHRRGF